MNPAIVNKEETIAASYLSIFGTRNGIYLTNIKMGTINKKAVYNAEKRVQMDLKRPPMPTNMNLSLCENHLLLLFWK